MLNLGFDYKVIKTERRKTASISVKDSNVLVTVPRTLSKHKVHEIVKKKKKWIQGKLNYYAQTQNLSKTKEYVSGEGFAYLGRNYRLKVLNGKLREVQFKNGKLVVHIPKEYSKRKKENTVKKFLKEWYQERALIKLQEKTKRLARKVGVEPKSVTIKSYKGRWGSCNAKQELFFNWNIIIAPNRIVDYVVVHELVHIIHHDHGKAYWKRLKSVYPDYEDCKEWLKVNGRNLKV
jgi:predicted metal-dependent hydrolase|tara:strand:- start:120 stop:821 length:702 start_codon:yes stop_codon:yes gene_type:complete